MKEKLIRFVNTDLNSWLFYISYSVYLFVSIINTSYFVVNYKFAIGTQLLILSILLLMCKEIINTPRSTNEKLGVLLGFAFLLVINFTIGDVVTDQVTWIVAFIICARDIDYEKVVRLTIVISSIMLAVVVFSSLFGIIENHYDSYVARPRHWVGFRYASFGPTLLFNISALVVYIRKEKRDRLLYELTNPRKRYRGLDRFCHHAGELIDPARIALQGDDLQRQEAFRRFMAAHPGTCLALSPDPALDGQRLPLAEAAALAFCITDASILLGEGYALVTGEAVKGGREHYLLTGEKR